MISLKESLILIVKYLMINIKNEKLDIVYYPEDGVVSFDIGTLKQFSPKS